ncbi:hypothetical protein [Ruegeria sp. THAF33]|jgi:hypothetical protein|uniref:hypothetical protein n=1 Tax=Ruegeria sp. THAF33 TaxID=2587853 RepID=UPI0012AAAEC4|nr:hypothetical protein [Ruegeria sp. THAF33]QFT74969.1 hypothetical protein FIU92_18165 [Ruegeria sp. THAF33]
MQARVKKTGRSKREATKWLQFRNSVLRLFGVDGSFRPERGAEGGIQKVAVEKATTFYLP